MRALFVAALFTLLACSSNSATGPAEEQIEADSAARDSARGEQPPQERVAGQPKIDIKQMKIVGDDPEPFSVEGLAQERRIFTKRAVRWLRQKAERVKDLDVETPLLEIEAQLRFATAVALGSRGADEDLPQPFAVRLEGAANQRRAGLVLRTEQTIARGLANQLHRVLLSRDGT